MTLIDCLSYSESMRAVFSDESRLQRMLDFEAALASAQAAVGLIPGGAANSIEAECRVAILDIPALREAAAHAGNLAIPLVKQLSQAVSKTSPEAARYVHWGATSQDVIDTGLVLQMRAAFGLLEDQLSKVCAGLAALAECHTATVMPGRTWLQQAVPITFGWKAAGWLDAMLRHRIRLREVRARALTLQFGGAAGTLAFIGEDAWAVSQELAQELELAQPDISWHASRDRIGEVATVLGLIVASLGKVARDVSLLMQTEVGEAFEGAGEGRGGSSTMPQKRNPVVCASILAAAVRVPGLVATVLSSMAQEHERGLGNWQAEWETLPEIFNLCAGALGRATELIGGLEIDSDRMAANLELTNGLVYAEAVAAALAKRIGRPAAHEVMNRASEEAIARKRHLRDVLLDDAAFTREVSTQELDRLFEPGRYLGITKQSINRVLARSAARNAHTHHSHIDLAGLRIHYQWSGAAEKPVLVLSNSLGADMSMWDEQVPLLSEHFRLLRYDVRGHGRSSSPPGPYSVELLSRDLLALLDGLGVVDFCFCGLSMGGLIGQWLAIHAAPRIHSLVLCNTGARIGNAEVWNARMNAVLKDGMATIVPIVLDRWFTPSFRQSHPEVEARARGMLEAANPNGYAACCGAIRDADLRSDLQRIHVPCLVVAGTHDPSTPPADGQFLGANIAGAQYVELNASHISNVEASEAFNRAVLDFLLKPTSPLGGINHNG
jgi:3-carboxy-cis,cis-muconate cycloisomerase/3-oxoadipate enol-lactonase